MKESRGAVRNRKLGLEANIYRLGKNDYLVEVSGFEVEIPAQRFRFEGPAYSYASDVIRFPDAYVENVRFNLRGKS